MAASATRHITHPGLWWTSEPHRCLLAVTWSCEPTLSLSCLLACQSTSQPARLSVTESAMQSPLPPRPGGSSSAPATASPAGASWSTLHPALLSPSGSHADPRLSPLVPPCTVSHFTAGALTHTRASREK